MRTELTNSTSALSSFFKGYCPLSVVVDKRSKLQSGVWRNWAGKGGIYPGDARPYRGDAGLYLGVTRVDVDIVRFSNASYLLGFPVNNLGPYIVFKKWHLTYGSKIKLMNILGIFINFINILTLLITYMRTFFQKIVKSWHKYIHKICRKHI